MPTRYSEWDLEYTELYGILVHCIPHASSTPGGLVEMLLNQLEHADGIRQCYLMHTIGCREE
jgi:hypothetical protein